MNELRAERRPGSNWGLFTQGYRGREEYRPRLGLVEAKQEAWDVTAQYYRDEYMRIEREVAARWGVGA